ncbi:unnamed protein product [Ambrosiozyma monospora]|uniref:Unnamed protein product n=1 Tax=Ambrosiozyma monospora TaxID=43982 RepID=A0A9W6YQR1_AMBMO|nr:unnamed protein product [Ambrosiozyma monospora]
MASPIPLGFKNLPITNFIGGFIVFFPLLISLLDLKKYFIFAYDPFISEYGQYFRYFIIQFCFVNESQVVLAAFIYILSLKNLERVYGSLKYLKLVIFMLFYNFIGIVLVSLLLRIIGINMFIPAGPIGLIVGLFYLYCNTTPVTFRVNLILGGHKFELSNDFINSIAVFQLALSDGPISSLILSGIGLSIGMLTYNNLLPFSKLQWKWFDSFYHRFATSKTARSRPSQSTTDSGSDGQRDGLRDAPQNEQDVPLLDDDENLRERDDTPVRPLGSQLLDTFRR